MAASPFDAPAGSDAVPRGQRLKRAIRWRALTRAQGDAKPKALGGPHRGSCGADPAAGRGDPGHHARELKTRLAAQGIGVGVATLWRFFDRRRITLKKDGARGRAESPRHFEAA